MRLVEDRQGRRFGLLKRSVDSSLVLDLETGRRSYRPNDNLRPVNGENVDPRTELLATLSTDDAIPVRTVIERTTLCESELFAVSRELELAGVIREATCDGERAWMLSGEHSIDTGQS